MHKAITVGHFGSFFPFLNLQIVLEERHVKAANPSSVICLSSIR